VLCVVFGWNSFAYLLFFSRYSKTKQDYVYDDVDDEAYVDNENENDDQAYEPKKDGRKRSGKKENKDTDMDVSPSYSSTPRRKHKAYPPRLPKGVACLRHRHMHKRCPPECPDRRAMQENSPPSSPGPSSPVEAPVTPPKSEKHHGRKRMKSSFDASSSSANSSPASSRSSSPLLDPSQAMVLSNSNSLRRRANENAMENSMEHSPAADALLGPFFGSNLVFQNLNLAWDSPATDLFSDLISNDPKSDGDLAVNTWADGECLARSNSFSVVGDDSATPSSDMSRDQALDSESDNSAVETQQRQLLSKLLINRPTMLRFLANPLFNSLMTGLYVRICVSDGVHRLCQVREVLDSYYTRYIVDNVLTDKALLLQLGSQSKVFSIVDVSEMEATESEISLWRQEMVRSNCVLDEMQVKQKVDLLLQVAVAQFSAQSQISNNLTVNSLPHHLHLHHVELCHGNNRMASGFNKDPFTHPHSQNQPLGPSILSNPISISLYESSTFDPTHYGDIYSD